MRSASWPRAGTSSKGPALATLPQQATPAVIWTARRDKGCSLMAAVTGYGRHEVIHAAAGAILAPQAAVDHTGRLWAVWQQWPRKPAAAPRARPRIVAAPPAACCDHTRPAQLVRTDIALPRWSVRLVTYPGHRPRRRVVVRLGRVGRHCLSGRRLPRARWWDLGRTGPGLTGANRLVPPHTRCRRGRRLRLGGLEPHHALGGVEPPLQPHSLPPRCHRDCGCSRRPQCRPRPRPTGAGASLDASRWLQSRSGTRPRMSSSTRSRRALSSARRDRSCSSGSSVAPRSRISAGPSPRCSIRAPIGLRRNV